MFFASPLQKSDLGSLPPRAEVPRWFAAFAIAIALVLYYLALVVSAERNDSNGRRDDILINVAALTSARSSNAIDDGTNLHLAADAGVASAAWDTYSYEVTHLVRHARSCRMSAVIVGLGLTSRTSRGVAEILVNGSSIKRIHFGATRRGFFPVAERRLVPSNVTPQLVELVPLDARYAIVAPIPNHYCSASLSTIGVRVRDATWTVEREGILLSYVPAPFSTTRGLLTTLAAAIVIAAGLAALYFILRGMLLLGWAPVAATVAALVGAPLTYDQWDFRLWTSFGEFAIFGASNPAHLWFGSPLWTFVPAMFASVTGAEFYLTGHGSDASTSLFMKIGMSLAYCYTAYQIAERAPRPLRSYFAITTLILPVSLYELAGGYRETVAAAAAIACLVSARNSRLVLATLLAVVAASIAEELLPLVAFPAVLAISSCIRRRADIGSAVFILFIGIAAFAAEWRFLIPADVAVAALRYRFGSAPLGNASWAGALQGLGLLPEWLPVRSVLFNATLFVCFASIPAIRLARALRSKRSRTERAVFDDVVGVFVALVGAFLIAFRGTDPNLWYSLIVLSLWYIAAAEPLNPFPFLLGSIEGLTFYVTVGLRDFVNHSFFWPVDVGLLGTLGATRYVLDLTVCALTIVWIVSMSLDTRRRLISPSTPFVWFVFIAALLVVATGTYALDAVIVLIGSTFFGALLSRLSHAPNLTKFRPPRVGALFRVVNVLLFASIGAICATRSGLAGFCAISAGAFAIRRRLAACDVVLLLAASGVVAVQTGAGIVSRLASGAFILLLLVALFGMDERFGDFVCRLRRLETLAVRRENPLGSHDVVRGQIR